MSEQNILEKTAPQATFIWRDLKWVNREPVVNIEPLIEGKPSGSIVPVPLIPGSFLGIAPLVEGAPGAGCYCSGYAVARTDATGFAHLPCPKAEIITKGKQCPRCLALDEFAPIHRVHQGARMTEAALAYVDLEHYLYIATFPDGTSKVGTSSLLVKNSASASSKFSLIVST